MQVGVRLVVKGLVQGVGFRWFVTRTAERLGVAGYVRNLPNGEVEIEAEGERGQIEELIQSVKRGPAFARVKDMVVEWQDYAHKFDTFEIRH